MSTTRKTPTSVLKHECERLKNEIYRACADGRIHDLRKANKKFKMAQQQYRDRITEEQEALRIKEEKRLTREAVRQAKLQAKLEKQKLRKENTH